jgi:hypothetical protein
VVKFYTWLYSLHSGLCRTLTQNAARLKI